MSEESTNPTNEQASHVSSVRESWSFGADRIQEHLSHDDPDTANTMIGAFRWCIDPAHPMKRQEFAARIGQNENTIYRIYAGKYVNEQGERLPVPKKVVKAVKEFLRLEKERFEAGENEFVETPTAKKIFLTCEFARESGTIAILWGPSHIGKTEALSYYTAANNHGRTIMVKLDAASGLGGMVKTFATACGISHKSNTLALVERIKRALTRDTLVIIDEMHLLQHTYRRHSFFACVEVIRRIQDFTKCGMILCFTMLDELKAASQAELQQVWRRGVHRCELDPMPSIGDLTAIFAHHGLDFPDPELVVTVKRLTEKPYELLALLAERDGLLAITERLRGARKLAKRRARPLSWELFIEAHLIIAKQAQTNPKWGPKHEKKKKDPEAGQ